MTTQIQGFDIETGNVAKGKLIMLNGDYAYMRNEEQAVIRLSRESLAWYSVSGDIQQAREVMRRVTDLNGIQADLRATGVTRITFENNANPGETVHIEVEENLFRVNTFKNGKIRNKREMRGIDTLIKWIDARTR